VKKNSFNDSEDDKPLSSLKKVQPKASPKILKTLPQSTPPKTLESLVKQDSSPNEKLSVTVKGIFTPRNLIILASSQNNGKMELL
jgi:hypothetical protein